MLGLFIIKLKSNYVFYKSFIYGMIIIIYYDKDFFRFGISNELKATGDKDMDKLTSKEWINAKCDKYDYLAAAACGGLAGLVDIIFVKVFVKDSDTSKDLPTSKLTKFSDKMADKFVMKAAEVFYAKDTRTTGRPKKCPQTLEQCISYLEQAFPVNYDARYAKDLKVKEGVLNGMNSKNHHLLSLGHSTDPIGLIVSIISQFTGSGTFIDHGKVITATPAKTSKSVPYMQGHNFPSMLFCGFVNWIGHLISDIVGSSSTRKEGKKGRGMGVPIPFYELFLMCDFGDFNGNTFAETMTKVYEEGYDLRFGAVMSVPVVFQELMVRCIWIIRQKFMRKKPWNECMPTSKHSDLRVMLLVGNGTLCLVDGIDAAVRGISSKSWVTAICHLNLVGWTRLATLAIKEVIIRAGFALSDADDPFYEKIFGRLSQEEKQKILFFEEKIREYVSYTNVLETLKASLDDLKLAKEERIRIEKECAEQIEKIQDYRNEMGHVLEDYLCNYLNAFEDGFIQMDKAVKENDIDGFISGNNVIQESLNRESQFSNQKELDDLMGSDISFKL